MGRVWPADDRAPPRNPMAPSHFSPRGMRPLCDCRRLWVVPAQGLTHEHVPNIVARSITVAPPVDMGSRLRGNDSAESLPPHHQIVPVDIRGTAVERGSV